MSMTTLDDTRLILAKAVEMKVAVLKADADRLNIMVHFKLNSIL